MMHAAGGRGGKAWTPTAYGGSTCQPGVRPSAAAVAHLGGDGNLRRRRGGAEGRRGHGEHAGWGGVVGWWVGRAREGVGGAVSSAASATVWLTGEEGRPGLAKVGRGARGARGAGGRGQRWGPHPARRGQIPPSIIHGGEP